MLYSPAWSLFLRTSAYSFFGLCRLLVFGLLLAPALASAQQVLLQTDVALDTLPARTGPNRAWFGHLYAGLAPAVGPGAGLAVRYGLASAEWQLGGRLKRRLSGGLALSADLRYALLRYGLPDATARAAPPVVPGATNQSLSYQQLQGEVSLRLNPGRGRGNAVGTYLDVLAYGGRALSTRYAYTQTLPGRPTLEVSEANPAYLARWLGGVGLRLGRNSLALSGRYRLSDALRPVPGVSGPAEPPRWLLGLEWSWF